MGDHIQFQKKQYQHGYPVVMSPSWNFPARAEPSYEGSEPSQAELGHFNFRAETELTSDSMYVKKSQNYIENLLILDFFHN